MKIPSGCRTGATKRRDVALLLVIALAAAAGGPSPRAVGTGPNGGIRLLLHAEKFGVPPGGISVDPCSLHVPLESLDEFVVDWDAGADTVMVWAYLFHPAEMAVCGAAFAIELEEVSFLSSGSCARLAIQDSTQMGRWGSNGSEIVYIWMPEDCLQGALAPIGWFVLAASGADGYFRVSAGTSPFCGAVGDTSHPPHTNPIWDYGTIGFGETSGVLPVPQEAFTPRSSGALEIRLR